MKRAVITGVSAAVAVTLVATVHVRREREWTHGGDDVRVAVEVVAATEADFADVTQRFGVPAGKATRVMMADQSIVVRVKWSGIRSGGSLEVIALDGRVEPPRLLAADGGWTSEGSTGSNWASAYDVLAERYDWLRGVEAASQPDMPTAAVSAPATGSGSVTAWFRQHREGALPFRDASAEVVVALLRVDDSGDVRWARRVSG